MGQFNLQTFRGWNVSGKLREKIINAIACGYQHISQFFRLLCYIEFESWVVLKRIDILSFLLIIPGLELTIRNQYLQHNA